MSNLEVALNPDDLDLDDQFSGAMSTALSEGLSAPANVVDFTGPSRPPRATVEPAPLDSLEDHAEFHRKAANEYDRRKGQAQSDAKAAAAAIRAERKALRDKFDADLAALADREAQTKAEIAQRVMMAQCLGEASRAAVRTIEKHL